MKFQVLLATMNKQKHEIPILIERCKLHADILVINQCGRNNLYEFNEDGCKIKVCEVAEKGLSRSRNKALKFSDADICLIADDDILYENDLENKICNAFDMNPDYDIIAFFVERSSNFKQMKKGKRHKVGKIQSLSLMSVQIAFRRKRIIDKSLSFDENFGAGSGMYICGEENIFLMDCLNAGCRILYMPELIARTEDTESSWFKGFDELYFVSKGAVFQRLFPILSIPMIYAFVFLKYQMYKNDVKCLKALKFMLEGRKECLGFKK